MLAVAAGRAVALSGSFRFFQIAYVTSDLERASRELGALYGVEQFQTTRDVPIETQRGVAQTHFALAFVGEQQLEIIEPAGGADSVYRDALPSREFAVGLHHFGYLITDLNEWERAKASIQADGYAMPVDGIFAREGVPLMHYVYADTRRPLGHYLEFMYQTAAGHGLFAAVPRY